MKSFSLCMCSVSLIGFEDLKVFSFSSFFPTFSLLFFLSYSFFFSTPKCPAFAL